MRVGISLPLSHPSGRCLTAAEVVAFAQHVEAAGFDGIWLSDVVGRGTVPRPDALMWLTLAAAATQHVELGTSIFQVAVRAPVDVAQRLMTLYGVSGGRFSAGLGSGSSARDFEAAGLPFDQRFKLLADNLAIIRDLCHGEVTESSPLVPWSNTVGAPPLLIGAWRSDRWIRRAARDFDGWLTSGAGPGGNTFKNLKEGIRMFRDHGGKRAIVATVQFDVSQPGEPLTDEARFSLRCSPQEARERVNILSELGYDDVLLRKDDLTDDEIDAVADALNLSRRQ